MENSIHPPSSGSDPELWQIAKRRASFKHHLGIYIIINGFLWALWFFTGNEENTTRAGYPWPVWSTFGWGIGLLFHYLGAYVYSKENSTAKEYEKLVRNKKSSKNQ